MSNNKNPHDVDGNQVRNKSRDNDVVRATVIDVLPDIHSVRVNPRGDNAPVVAPVSTPTYGMSVLPDEGERVTLLYITENVPIVIGSIYLRDGPNPPEAEVGDAVFGNSTGSEITIRDDGSISVGTDTDEPVDIDHQTAVAQMSSDQSIAGDDTYYKVNFDTAVDNPKGIYDTSQKAVVVKDGGQHSIHATIEVPLPEQNNRYTAAFFRNGTVFKQKNQQSVTNNALSITVDTRRDLDAGDVIDVRLRQNSGSSKTINSDFVATEFNIQREGM